MEVATFAELEPEFLSRVHSVVWCSVATVDRQGRPRSRILHPIWEGPVGWIATHRNSFKAQHLAHNPYISLAYVGDVGKPVYAECRAEWDDTQEAKQRLWDMFLAAPPPLGYDPAPIFKSVDDPSFGALRLTPWRIEVTDFPQGTRVWHNQAERPR